MAMTKHTVAYKDFNDVEQVDELRFVITKSRLTDNMDLKERLEMLQRLLSGPSKEMSMTEIQQIMDLVKEFIRIGYGVLKEDGKTFRQDEELYNDFKFSAAYDAFLFSLFKDPEKAINFMMAILPDDLTVEARRMIDSGEIKLDGSPVEVTEPPVAPQASDPTPTVTSVVTPATDEKTWYQYSQQELLDMDQAQFDHVAGTDPIVLNQRGLLGLAYERKSRG